MKPTVLTIEDQPDIRRLIRMTLEYKGFNVIEAAHGEEGLRMAREHKPALVLLDVMMPGMNGLTAGEIMTRDPVLSRIPVVMLSALGTAGDVEAGLATGVQAYLIKPFSPWELLHIVHRLIAATPPTKGEQEVSPSTLR